MTWTARRQGTPLVIDDATRPSAETHSITIFGILSTRREERRRHANSSDRNFHNQNHVRGSTFFELLPRGTVSSKFGRVRGFPQQPEGNMYMKLMRPCQWSEVDLVIDVKSSERLCPRVRESQEHSIRQEGQALYNQAA